MSTQGGLESEPLSNGFEFNWIFLVVLLVCGIVTLFFLFYFNRLFATLVSYGLRAWTWHRYRVYVDIQTLQLSLLAGRIFFKGVRYHGNNETILIHSGQITWCYWLRAVRELDLNRDQISKDVKDQPAQESDNASKEGRARSLSGAESGGTKKDADLPCKLNISLQGVEWFVYNRSAAYDAVILGMTKDLDEEAAENVDGGNSTADSPDSKVRRRAKRSAARPKGQSLDLEKSPSGASVTQRTSNPSSSDEPKLREFSATMQTEGSSDDEPSNSSTEDSYYLRFLPIHIDCQKAAVVLGNEHTKSVLITKADRISGEVDATKSLNPIDHYKQLFNFNFEHPVVQMKPNDDYKEDHTAAATRIKRGTEQPEEKKPNFYSHSFWHRQRRRAWHKLQDLVPVFRSSVESFSSTVDDHPDANGCPLPGSGHWQGLSRYLEEGEQDDRARWSAIEYATVTTIADCPHAKMSFYWDVVGNVQEKPSQAKASRRKKAMNVNGDIAPEWGINLSLEGAIINYGPWADRQRAEIQRVFFPFLCKDAVPSKPLSPGQPRLPTEFKVYIELDHDTTLRVPIREESKNWKWAKHVDTMGPEDSQKKTSRNRRGKADKGNTGVEIRPFGWLDIKIGANATVAYVMDMMAGKSGYSNAVKLDIPSIEITTSVNHGVLLRSLRSSVSCDLSNPLQWNGHHDWIFDIDSNGMELFILREHVFLFIDLVDDWAGGPPQEYLTFSPFNYIANLHLTDFEIYLNVNDANIINNPSDFDDNTFVSVFGEVLNARIGMPLTFYRPHRQDISFDIDAHTGGLKLHVPPWNTQATFLSSNIIATLNDLLIDGTYQYCSTTSPANTDTLLLNVHGNSPTAWLYGFVIRYYLKVKDNYFGDDIRFKTLEEYQDVLRAKRDGVDDLPPQPPYKKSNDLDVVLCVTADDTNAILPANLYSSKNHVRIEIANLAADLRFTNYYMDLDVVFKTLAFSLGSEEDGTSTPVSATSSTQLFIDGINICGNRLFGLPPLEPTYICNWDFAVGAISGECTTEFFGRLASGGRALGFSFDDDENALPLIMEIILNDVTFLRAYVESVRVWIHVEEAAFLFATGDISVNFNDWASSHYSKKLNLKIPDMQIACVDAESASRHRSRTQHPVETHALVQTTISFVMIQRKLGFATERLLQQEHLKRHDQRTHRSDFLLHAHLLDDSMLVPVDPPAISIPPMPTPIIMESHKVSENGSFRSSQFSSIRHKRTIGRKSSFLSMSATSQKSDGSVIRSHSPKKPGEAMFADSRSRSAQNGSRLSHRVPLRDVSAASTGRHSAFYSAVGEHRGLPPSSVIFSSSYIEPYFPLEGVEPDSRDLPNIANADEKTTADEQIPMTLNDIQKGRIGEDTEHVSFILELPCGVRGVFNSQAVDAIAGLLTALQHVDPVDILDDLQIDSMNEIFELNSQKKRTNKVSDFKIHTPGISMRFLNASDPDGASSNSNASDQYDLTITDLAVTTRSKTKAATESPIPDVENASAFHLLLSSVSLAAKERYNDLDDPQAAIDVVLQDVVFWMASGKERCLNLRFSDFQVSTASSKIEYLASLLHRTRFVASNLAGTFSSRIRQQNIRIQLFTYLVATSGHKTPDPLFLTRPSYVLRSADNHLRSCDSWKVVTRLHHMYTNLDAHTQQDIMLRCLDNTESLPGGAKKGVLAGFNEWRSWDLNNVHKCLVMERVYGSSKDPSIVLEKAVPTKVSFSTRGMRLILDPGPKQNEISISALSATAESKTKQEENSDSQVIMAPIQSTVVQLICSDVSINLNWELCELANDILKLYHQSEKTQATPPASPVHQETDTMATQHDLQIVVATETGSITIDTINLRAIMISDGMKGSFVTTANANGDALRTSTLLIAARAATTKLLSHSQELTLYQLRHPSIFAGHETVRIGSILGNVVKLAANCQQLSFTVCQEILALLEVVDLVIGDEVEQLYQLMKRIPGNDQSQSIGPSQKPPKPSFTKINVALFLDMYRIKIPLLRSLVYEVSGVIARGSIAAQLGSEIILDFDVKQTMHDMRTVGDLSNNSISSIYIPPTNGRITTHMSQEETSVTVFTSVELIELDAASIHGLVSALNRPEMTSVLTDIQEYVREIHIHIEDVFGHEDKPVARPVSPNTSSPFVYDVHLTLAGLNIYADAQKDSQGHSTAKLEFKMGCVQLVLANRLEQQGPVLNYPELRADVRHIMFELSRWNGSAMEPCGNLYFAAFLHATSKLNESGNEVRSFHLKSNGLEINLFADTASSVVDIIGYLQEKIKTLDFSREKKYLRKLRKSRPKIAVSEYGSDNGDNMSASTILFASMYSLELLNIQISWIVGTYEHERFSKFEPENLVLSLKRIDLSTRKENSARLAITDLQLQMVPASYDKTQRSYNSALLPEVIFNVGYVSTTDARRLIFQAAGKSLDLRLTSQFIIPAAELQKSINSAAKKVRAASETWMTPNVEHPVDTVDTTKRKPFFGKKRMESLLVDADFAGAVVYLTGKKSTDVQGSGRLPQPGRYGQFSDNETSKNTTLQAPGLAWKVEYKDNGILEPSLNAEVKVDGSENILYPTVVPLIMDIISAVKDMVSDEEGDKKNEEQKASSPQKFFNVEEDNILAADPSAVLGRTRLNLGLRICRQEFSLSCHPIARVSATAKFEDIYITINTVRSPEHGHFFAATAAFTNLEVSVQHVYSRDPTAKFEVNSVFLSLMNSKHVSGTSGLSAILKISPMKVQVNAKQLQDFLLFREIWVPEEIRQGGAPIIPTTPALHNQTILVQRYQQVAATGAFPWNATISIAELDVQLDLGQAIGKSVFIISNFWISSKKNSDWEQNLCLGFDKIGIDSTGRMSGFVALQNFKLRTSIQWPAREMALNQTPLVQASLAFSQFRVKAAFDYQAFFVADVTSFEFLMYNVRNSHQGKGDRLVAILDGDAVQLFCTATSAAQALAVYQAFQKLIQEKRTNYESSLLEIEKFTKRKSVSHPQPSPLPRAPTDPLDQDKESKSPISLHTDVIVTLKAVNIGVFPSSFSDHQVFKLEALNAQARFAVIMNAGKIHSILGLTLGQLRIGLAAVKKVQAPKSVDEISVEDVVSSATGSRGGTILKVPKVEAVMQTWQVPNSNKIDYIFKSSFEGKVEVGWNYSRISYIRNMWAAHAKALALKLGKPLSQSAVKLTGVPGEEEGGGDGGESKKITAEVNVPVSKYEYTALEEPVIEAPQLRDMGEATPPLEWIGLHRDRLPNLTHQIVIVTLLEVASEVEDAYGKILGTT